jgi:Swt1-like HEPN
VEHALNDLESNGLAVRSPTDPQALQRMMPLDDFSAELRRAAMRALPAYLAFFCLENSVRELVVERLQERHGSGWWATCATRPVRDKVAKRQESEGANRWHSRRGATEIYYTDFGDLMSVIRQNWTDFEDLFPDINWITSRLTELEASRNIVAHNNLLESREVERIKMYLMDWVRQVG